MLQENWNSFFFSLLLVKYMRIDVHVLLCSSTNASLSVLPETVLSLSKNNAVNYSTLI